MASITIRGDKAVRRNLQKLQGAELDRRLGNAALGIGKELEGIMKPYPPPPAESTYRRTGNLKRRWSTKRRNRAAVVGNPTPYAGWVQGAEEQTGTHRRTGWRTDEQGADEMSGRTETINRIVLGALLKGVV